MPDQFSCVGIEREQRVRVEVVADAVGAVEVGGRRSRRDVDDAARPVERHARPAVRAAVLFPRILRPGLVPGFAGMRNRMKTPLEFAGPRVVRADVAGRRRQVFRHAPAKDQQVLVDDAGRGEDNGLACRIASEIAVEIDPAAIAERRYRLAGPGIERVNVTRDCGIDSTIAGAVGPVHHAAVSALRLDARIKRPQVLACRGAEREGFVPRRDAVEDAVDDDRLRLQTSGLAAVVDPRLFELFDVAAIDLSERRVPDLLRPTAVGRPAAIARLGRRRRLPRAPQRHRQAVRRGRWRRPGQQDEQDNGDDTFHRDPLSLGSRSPLSWPVVPLALPRHLISPVASLLAHRRHSATDRLRAGRCRRALSLIDRARS